MQQEHGDLLAPENSEQVTIRLIVYLAMFRRHQKMIVLVVVVVVVVVLNFCLIFVLIFVINVVIIVIVDVVNVYAMGNVNV